MLGVAVIVERVWGVLVVKLIAGIALRLLWRQYNLCGPQLWWPGWWVVGAGRDGPATATRRRAGERKLTRAALALVCSLLMANGLAGKPERAQRLRKCR